MGRISTGWVLLLAVLTAAAVSCSRPVSTESFVGVDQTETDGLYKYSLDLSDSLATYDIVFYSRIDASRQRMAVTRDFPLTVTWTSPSGRRYRETVYFGIHDESSGSSFYSSQYRKTYRSGLVPVEWGVWSMAVQVNSGREVPGFRGRGVVCKKNIGDGTR